MNYQEFIDSKKIQIKKSGFECNELNPILFEYQKLLVKWALKKGKCALFTGTGTGKTVMQCEWAYRVWLKEQNPILILAPLAVAHQTIKEAKDKLNVDIKFCENSEDVINGLNITNYEKLQKFDTSVFIGIVLDESSILKSFTSATRNEIIDNFNQTPYKLACSATPAPNDYMELGNHSEFLNELKRKEMLSMFFVNDCKETQKWRLKGHAKSEFWKWVSTWALIMNNPKDLGYDDKMFELPELKIYQEVVKNTDYNNGKLFVMEAKTLQERRNARKNSLDDRCKKASELVNNSNDKWLVWCDLNSESELLSKLINDSVEVKGSDNDNHKKNTMLDFADGKIKSLISKPSICGFGMNFQVCHNVIFVGLSDSFEQYYQAIRRCYRFGQKENVNVYIITSEAEGAVIKNIQRKEQDALNMIAEMSKYTKKYVIENVKNDAKVMTSDYIPTENMVIPEWLIRESEVLV